MQKPNRDLPRLLRDYSFGNFLKCTLCQFGKGFLQEILLLLWHFDTISQFTLPLPVSKGLADLM